MYSAFARHVAQDQHEAERLAAVTRCADPRRHRLHRNLEAIAALQQHVRSFTDGANAEAGIVDRIKRLAVMRVQQPYGLGQRPFEAFAGKTSNNALRPPDS